MLKPRRSLLNLRDTSHYHLTVRCVRRAWLCGIDAHSGRDCSHRKTWLCERLVQLSRVFCIDLCAYALMPNYYELVCHVDHERCAQLTDAEVVQRWSAVFRAPDIIEQWRRGVLDEAGEATAVQLVERWRAQLCDLSWFMRCLNQHFARRANLEDDCTGAFWETRFKSRPLYDAASVLTAMAQVDLNPIRMPLSAAAAAVAATSMQSRIEQSFRAGTDSASMSFVPLAACGSNCIPFTFRDYLQLLDWTGRRLQASGRAVESRAPLLLQQLAIDVERWLLAMRRTPRGPARRQPPVSARSEASLQGGAISGDAFDRV